MTRALLLGAVLLGSVACDPLATTPIPSVNAADSATVSPLLQSTLALSKTVEQLTRTIGIAAPTPDSLLWTNAAKCTPDSFTQGYDCPFVSIGPTSFTSYILYRDTTRWPGFDPATTSSIKVQWTASRTIGNPSNQVHDDTDAHLFVTLSGLKTGPRVFDGFGGASYYSEPSGFGTSVTFVITKVQIGADSYPVGGSIVGNSSTTDAGGTTYTSISLTFDGSSTGKFTWVKGSVTQNCAMPLQSPATKAVCSP